MNDPEKILSKMLSDSGTIGKLRQKIISLLLMVEDISVSFDDPNDEEMENARILVEKLELLLNEFSISQNIADKIFAKLSPDRRITIQQEAPELFDIFGWHDKIGKNGDLEDIIS